MRRGSRGRRPGWSTQANEIVDRVFVYGTLRQGQAARSMIANHVRGAEPATMEGRIYAFTDGYPGLVDEGGETVVGEIVYLEDLASAFALLDAYEGAEFIRVLKRARLADGTDSWAWCYILADPEMAQRGELIADGDWCGYAAAQYR